LGLVGIFLPGIEDVTPHDIASDKPYVTYRDGDKVIRIDCEYIVGAPMASTASAASRFHQMCCVNMSACIRSAGLACCRH
jgi:hypothetical protein